MDITIYGNELYHHGILGQKWGIRRYQNEDGTLTTAGKRRYGVKSVDEWKSKKKEMRKRESQLGYEADKKFKLNKKKTAKDMEDLYNDQVVRKNAEFWYGEGSSRKYSSNANYYAQKRYEDSKLTTNNKSYEDAYRKANKFIEESMKNEYGKSYTTWKEEKETKELIYSGIGLVASLALTIGSTVALQKYASKH